VTHVHIFKENFKHYSSIRHMEGHLLSPKRKQCSSVNLQHQGQFFYLFNDIWCFIPFR
jgi:hypothetical protein